MLVLLDASVDFRIAGSRGVEVGSVWGGGRRLGTDSVATQMDLANRRSL